MRVTIWDLDYYYTKEKVNCFNPDVMKISSFHKQSGDKVNFVMEQDDIYRPYDIYYMIKENKKTKNPPLDFFTNPKVKWWGQAFKPRINWRMPPAMMACRPDYLLYPEKNTKLERAEQIRLLDNKGNMLPLVQDWTNAFTNKRAIVTDKNLWTSSNKTIKQVLDKLQEVKNVTFFEPIWIQKLVVDQNIFEKFINLNLTPGCNLQWLEINMEDYDTAAEVWQEIKAQKPHIALGPLRVRFYAPDHWLDRDNAQLDFNRLKEIIVDAKKRKVSIEIKMIQSRMDTPYFFLFETLAEWTKEDFRLSWLEYITKKYGRGLQFDRNAMFWSRPQEWKETFRDLLRQTWEDKAFLLTQWGEDAISINDIPWMIWKDAFKIGL